MDKTGIIWHVDSRRRLRVLRGHNDMVSNVLFMPDRDEVVTASWDRTVKVWNASRELACSDLPLQGKLIGHLAFGPEGRMIASAGAEGVRLWDLSAGKEVFHLDAPYACASLCSDGTLLATGGSTDPLRIWDVSRAAGGQQATEVRDLGTHPGGVKAVSFRPDGRLLASASLGDRGPGEVYFWDADTGRQVGLLRGLKIGAVHLAWRPDGRHLATLMWDGTVQIWEPATRKEVRSLRPAEEFRNTYLAAGALAYSPDGKLLAASATSTLDSQRRPEIVIWDTVTGEVRQRIHGHSAGIGGMTFSPDGQRLVSASYDPNRGAVGEVKLWDVATGTDILTLPGRMSVAFSPDGRFLAAVAGEALAAGVIKVWDGGNR
jgi:WD40 repeat protein